MTTPFKPLFLTLVLFAVAAPAWGQPTPPPEANRGGPQAAAARDQMGARMKALREDLLRREAGLDAAAAARAGKVHDQFAEDRKKLHRELREEMTAMRKLDTDGVADDAAYKKALDRTVAGHRALHELRAKEVDELRKVLSQRDAARVVLALERIQHAMRKEARQSRKAWLKQEIDRIDDEDEGAPVPPPSKLPRKAPR